MYVCIYVSIYLCMNECYIIQAPEGLINGITYNSINSRYLQFSGPDTSSKPMCL